MESIKELRETCRKQHRRGVTKPHWWATLFARRVSIYITWIIVKKTKISANQVTIWQLIASLFGMALLCFANAWIAFAGSLFLHLGYIFDNVDGEVARYRKTQSINGMFLDFVNHAVIIPMTFGCLAFHCYFLTGSISYFVLGIVIILFRNGPIGKARLTTVRYLVEKRRSPTYDIRNYQNSVRTKSSATLYDQQPRGGIKGLVKNIRKAIRRVLNYPNDLIVISAIVLIELVSHKPVFGILFLIFYGIYLVGDFILDVYVHLRNQVPEREFYNYVNSCSEIKAVIDNPSTEQK